MRKVIFNIFLTLELILNIKVLMAIYLAASVFAMVCSYEASVAENYGSYLLSVDGFLSSIITVVVLVSLVATSLKMLINETGSGLGLGFVKAVVPFIVGVVLILVSPSVTEFLINKFSSESEFQQLVFTHLTTFWVLLIIVVAKSVVNSNAGFTEVTQLTGSNDVALKYFDGILSDVDLDLCDILVLKYGGEDSNE